MAQTLTKDENLRYIWIQIENWLKTYYNAPIQVIVRESKELYSEKRYAKTVFSKESVPIVYIDNRLLLKGTKKELLFAGCREAVRIGLAYNKKPFGELDNEFRAELKKHSLPDYGGFSETGDYMFTYRCSSCKQPYILRKKPLSKKEQEMLCYKDSVRTKCCGGLIENALKVFYTNEELQTQYKKLSGNWSVSDTRE